ncbi:ribonuclease R [Streptococcus pantholopis]|uniref:Ribonuclease R n=1 Tax=Streptococcus pantholopis TaxID=1811193 RepID=A0A172Q656_9STRE|nr:ribonuclease R [Streptococcus pantholopis]AND78936.1 ribonuclease R [Streptococcus pantholopis]
MKEKIIDYLEKQGKTDVNDLAAALNMAGAKAFPTLIKAISKLESQGRLRFDNAGNLALRKKVSRKKPQITIKGLFRANKAGFGFLSVDGAEEELFIGRNDTGYAVDGDTVEVVITKVADRFKGTAAEAKVVGILDRQLKTAVGQFVLDDEKPKYCGYIKSRNPKIQQKIYIRKEPILLDGTEIIKVDIEKYPSRGHDYFVARVRDIIGHQGEAGLDVLEVLESMDIVSEFPQAVLDEAEAIADTPTEKDRIGRIDLRDELTFTIDGADAKDLDDAVHVKCLPDGHFELGVHIADVSYYVKENSALDREARRRGTSVYVTDRVVPMLPERLSNGICSLNPQVDRLTQSCIMEIDEQGQVLHYQLGQSIIRTRFRMTYDEVNAIIAGDEALSEKYAPIADSLKQMVALHQILEDMRIKRGALNFDTKEAKILVNSKGLPVDISLRQRGVGERLIESFMLLANETVAKHFAKRKLPFIYRIHEEPKAEKLQQFIDYASVFGVQIHGTANKMDQKDLQAFMAKIQGQPGQEVLATMLLRSMQQARYSEHNQGHYGLAAPYYTHFTSPIRRYPDLLVHRLLRDYGQSQTEKIDHFSQIIPEIAQESSSLERRAVDAERTVEAMKKAEYMAQFVGQEFTGLVSSVVKFGLFVELPNTIEGLIHISSLPEFYHYNERDLSLRGEKSGRVFRVGQLLKVKLLKADRETGDIDFAYVPSPDDTVEKNKTLPERKPQHNRKKRRPDQEGRKVSSKKGKASVKLKNKQPFYKSAAKKRRKKRRR